MERHLVGFLKEIRPKRVLFTTFTFDVPFFDAAVLPALTNKGGCEIAVLVDAHQLAAGVKGAFSQDAGLRYVLAPVKAPGGGVFHPKLAFLETDEEQYLCVGSGNLTAAGLSRQLECWDVVECSTAPDTLADFAEFLNELSTQVTASSPRAAAILRRVGRRASAAVRLVESGLPRGPKLIHTLTTPANAQLVAEFKTQSSNAQQLTVLSPFHSANGGPVKRLAKSIEAEALHLGHDGTAPFEKGWYPDSGSKNKFVTPKPADSRGNKGKLHAKVYELRADDQTLVMTGSINATYHSLETAENVEVGLARWYKTSPFKWTRLEPDRFEAATFSEGSEAGLLVEATLQVGSLITGVLSTTGGQALPKAMRWAVLEADRLHEEGDCSIGDAGAFQFLLKEPVRAAHLSLRLELRSGTGGIAQAWLNDEQSLFQASTGVRVEARLARAIQGVADLENITYIAGILSKALQGHLISPGAPGRAGTRVDDLSAAEEDGPFSYEEWRQSGTLRRQPQGTMSSSPDFLKAVYGLLFPKPEEPEDDDPKENESDGEPNIVLGEADDDEEQTVRRPRSKTSTHERSSKFSDNLKEMLAKACADIQDAFDVQRKGVQSPMTLALVVSAHELQKAEDRWNCWKDEGRPEIGIPWDHQKSFVLWLERLCRYPFDEQERQMLLPVACALACVAAYRAPPATSEDDPPFVRLPTLKSFLRRLAGRQLEDHEFAALVRAGLVDELFSRLNPMLREQTLNCAELLASAPQMDDALIAHIRAVVKGEPCDRVDELAFPALHKVLREHENPLAAIDITLERMVGEGGCPRCYMHFNDTERDKLRYCRVLQHPGTGRLGDVHLLVYPDDPVRLRAVLKELRNV